MSADLNKLAERCEAATGPDRELDIQIKAALYGGVALKSPFNGEWCVYRAGTDDPRTGEIVVRPRVIPFEQWSSDRYTASIDAAMTLVPEGCLFAAKTLWDGPLAVGYAVVTQYAEDRSMCDGKRYADQFTCAGQAPALALTAAALRARAALSTTPDLSRDEGRAL